MGRLVDVALRRRAVMAVSGALVMMASVLAALVAGASPARATGVTVTKDVQYGDAGGQQLLMDVYQPDGPGPFPAVILIHGGVFTHGDKSSLAPEGQWLASNGYAAFSIDYRLAPQFKYPDAVNDCQTAVRYLRSHAAQYHLNPQ